MRFDQCTETCTTDCGHCKGRPVEALRAEVVTLTTDRDHWRNLANEQPEPCPLDHGCDPEEGCSCWCMLHDCALGECPTFKTVEAWLATMREQHEKIVSKHTAERDRLRADLENALENADLVEGNLRTVISTAQAERDALAARLAQAERVVEAARAWRPLHGSQHEQCRPERCGQLTCALTRAVDALDGTAGAGEEGSDG